MNLHYGRLVNITGTSSFGFLPEERLMNKSKLWCRWGLGMLVLAMCVPMAMADGPDDQWSMSVKMSMTKPMSMSMPAITSKACRPAGADQGPPPMKNSDCKVKQWDRGGKKVSYEVTCNQGGTVMNGKGWTEADNKHMKGHMTMSGSASGTDMAMTVDYTGERIGSCTAEKPAESAAK